MRRKRVVMIGWDGADHATVDGWTRDGMLPNLASLCGRGVHGTLAGYPGLGDDACWGSFSTGTGPGTHGRFHHRQIIPATYRQDNFFRDRMSGTAFWSQIGDAGRRVAVLDVPKSPLAKNLNGIQLANWLPHGEDGPLMVSWPPSLANELPARFRKSGEFNCDRLRSGANDLADCRAQVRTHLQLRSELIQDWMGREDWDLFLAVFAESHCIGHHCWHLHDVHHPEHDEDVSRFLGDPVLDIHQALDASLGRIVSACSDDTIVIVFSLLGMGSNFSGNWLADAVLKKLEAHLPMSAPGLNRLTASMRRYANRMLRRNVPVEPSEHASRRAFVVHSDGPNTAIRLNLVGREPNGQIETGDYAVCSKFIAESFLALTDPDGGRPLVSDVIPVADRHRGPHATAYADLLIVWRNDAPVRRASSPATGIIDGTPPADRTGNHRQGGWFVAAGEGLPPNSNNNAATILDMAPTIGAFLDVKLSGMEGVPIAALSVRNSSNAI